MQPHPDPLVRSAPLPPRQPMYKLIIGGATGLDPRNPSTVSAGMTIQRCPDGRYCVITRTYLDPLGGEVIPPKPIIDPDTQRQARDKDGNPQWWPASRLLGNTIIHDSFLTAPFNLVQDKPPQHLHLGVFCNVLLARRPALTDAKDYYDSRDKRPVYRRPEPKVSTSPLYPTTGAGDDEDTHDLSPAAANAARDHVLTPRQLTNRDRSHDAPSSPPFEPSNL